MPRIRRRSPHRAPLPVGTAIPFDRFLAAIVESSDDAIISKTLAGTITSWNRGAEVLYGYAADEAVGQPISLIIPTDRPDELPAIMARLRRGGRIDHFETVRVRKDGARIDISVSISPIRDDTGRIVGAASIGRDITERMRAERQRRESEQAQQDFVAMVGHDLASPLTVLRARTQLMLRRGRFDEESLAAILEQTSRMDRLISDLRALAQVEGGGLSLQLADVDLIALGQQAVERARALTGAHHIRCDAPEVPIVVTGDEDRLGQVFDNLLGNAIKYSASGAEIVVRVEMTGDDAHLSVTDQGPGIPADALPQLFERFYRGPHASAGGLGLGLYICRMLITAHGGRIWATSEPGVGSTFTIALPLAPSTEQRPS
jgi:PAS domain S-box-containing protein